MKMNSKLNILIVLVVILSMGTLYGCISNKNSDKTDTEKKPKIGDEMLEKLKGKVVELMGDKRVKVEVTESNKDLKKGEEVEVEYSARVVSYMNVVESIQIGDEVSHFYRKGELNASGKTKVLSTDVLYIGFRDEFVIGKIVELYENETLIVEVTKSDEYKEGVKLSVIYDKYEIPGVLDSAGRKPNIGEYVVVQYKNDNVEVVDEQIVIDCYRITKVE